MVFMRSCLPSLSWIPFVDGGGPSDSVGHVTGGEGTPSDGSEEERLAARHTADPADPFDPTDQSQASESAAPAAATTTIGPSLDRSRMTQPREPKCPAEDGSSPRHLQWTRPPPMCIDPAKTYLATLHTDRGDIVIELDTENAPQAVNHFVFLARWHYYDGVDFHRVRTYHDIQAGDPIRHPPGLRGNPGYWIPDELPDELTTGEPAYPIYTVGLANLFEPDTGSSIFFIVTGMGYGTDNALTRFGRVVQGRSVVNAIDDDTGLHGQDPTGEYAPTEPTVIRTVTITEQ